MFLGDREAPTRRSAAPVFHSTNFHDARPVDAVPALAAAPVALRPLGRADDAVVTAHLLRLGERSRRLRFGAPVTDLFVEAYARAGAGDGVARTGLFLDGTLRGIAELHRGEADPRTAEGAFSIETPFRGAGHGTRLFGALLERARENGVERIVLQCLRENRAMQRIARRFRSELTFEGSETIATLRVPPAVSSLALAG